MPKLFKYVMPIGLLVGGITAPLTGPLAGSTALAQAAAPRYATSATAAAPAPAPAFSAPSREAAVIMIRSAMLALTQANATNNYTVLHALGSQSFRNVQSPDRLASNFAAFRSNAIDLSPLAYLEPRMTTQPIVSNGQLRLVGLFPSAPMQVNFDMSFEPERGLWKMANISVELNKVGR